jgi:hypothetical protein
MKSTHPAVVHARRVFAGDVPGEAGRPWREWLIAGLSGGGGWVAVRKADPTGPLCVFPNCSLAQAKATLLAS